MNSDELAKFLAVANAVKNKRDTSVSFAIQSTNLSSFMESADSIKSRRTPAMEAPKPIQVDATAHYKRAFVCIDESGMKIVLSPTIHAVNQFATRFQAIDRHFIAENKEHAMHKMRDIFNKGCRIFDDHVATRNARHAPNCTVIKWGNSDIQFIVNLTTRGIITCELAGPYRTFNKMFDSARYDKIFKN